MQTTWWFQLQKKVEENMIQILLNIAMKILDSFVTTTKSIFVYKNKILLASLMVGCSNFLFLTVIVNAVLSDSIYMNILVGLSSSVGAYLAMKTNNKFSKDVSYLNIITCDTRESVVELVEYLRLHKIKNIVTDSYTRQWDKTLVVQAFANTREQSKLIDTYLENKEEKYLRQILD